MKAETEEKVVQITFDNKKFEKNIKTSINSVNTLDKSLQFKGSKKELKKVAKELQSLETKELNASLKETTEQGNRFVLTLKDIVKYKIVGRVIDTITNKTINLVKSMAGISNVVSGWEQYEQQVVTVGGILNNVTKNYEDEAKALEAVKDAMADVQWYADETSFSFNTLSDGIRQFTVAGLDLDKATQAAMGVTSVAGAAKVFDPYKVQSAMNAVSKSMQTGYIDLMRWTTLTNTAGIVTNEFAQALLDEGVSQGKLIKSYRGQLKTTNKGIIVTAENIGSTLHTHWASTEVITAALARYNSAANAVKETMDRISEGGATEAEMLEMQRLGFDKTTMTVSSVIKMMENLNYQFDELSLKALKSSQETSSFSQAVDSIRTAVRTAYGRGFELIFGDAKQSVELWSDVNQELYNMFLPGVNNLIDILNAWNPMEEGGMADLHEGIVNFFTILSTFKKIVSETFHEVFGGINAQGIAKLVKSFKDWTQSVLKNEKVMNGFKNTIKIIATILKAFINILKSAFSLFGSIMEILGPIIQYVADLVYQFSEWVNEMVDAGKVAEWIEKIVNGLKIALSFLISAIALFVEYIKSKVQPIIEWLGKNEYIQKVITWFSELINIFKTHEPIEAFGLAIEKVKNILISFWNTIKNKMEELGSKYSDPEKYPIISFFVALKDFILQFISFISEAVKGAAGLLKTFGEFIASEDETAKLVKKALIILGSIVAIFLIIRNTVPFFMSIMDVLDGLYTMLRGIKVRAYVEAFRSLATSILLMASSVYILSKMQDLGQLAKALAALGIIVAALILIIKMFVTKMDEAGNPKYVIQRIAGVMSIALSMSVMMLAVGIMCKSASNITLSQIGKVGLILLEIVVALSTLLLAAKISKGVKPMLFTIISIIISISVLFKVIKSMIEDTEKMKEILNKLNITDRQQNVFNSILTFMVLLDIALTVMMVALPKIKAKTTVVRKSFANTLAMFAGITALLMATAISIAILAVIPQAGLWKAMGVVATILSVIGAIAVLLTAFGKVVERDFSKGGSRKWSSVKSSPAAGIILAMTVAVASCLIMIKLANKISPEELKYGGSIVGIIVGLFAVFAIALASITSQGKKSNFDKTPVTLNQITLAIAVLVASIVTIVMILQDNDPKSIWIAVGIVSGMIAALILALAAINKISKNKFASASDIRKAQKMMITISACILAMTGAIFIITKSGASIADTIIAGLIISYEAGVMIALISLIGVMSKQTAFNSDRIKKVVKLLITLTACIFAIGIVIAAIATIGWKDCAIAAGIIIVIMAAMIGILELFKLITSDMENIKLAPAIGLFAVLVGAFILIGAVLIAISLIGVDLSIKAAAIILGVMLVMVGIIALLGVMGSLSAKALIGILAMALLEIIMLGVVVIFKLLESIDFDKIKSQLIALGVTLGIMVGVLAILSVISPMCMLGILALALLEIAMIGLVGIFKLLETVDIIAIMPQLIALGVSLAVLVAAIMLLGSLGPVALAGAAAIAIVVDAIGLAVEMIGDAANRLGQGLQLISQSLHEMTAEDIQKLSDMAPGILKMTGALMASANPITLLSMKSFCKQFNKVLETINDADLDTEEVDKFILLADAIDKLAESLSKFKEIGDIKTILDQIDRLANTSTDFPFGFTLSQGEDIIYGFGKGLNNVIEQVQKVHTLFTGASPSNQTTNNQTINNQRYSTQTTVNVTSGVALDYDTARLVNAQLASAGSRRR